MRNVRSLTILRQQGDVNSQGATVRCYWRRTDSCGLTMMKNKHKEEGGEKTPHRA